MKKLLIRSLFFALLLLFSLNLSGQNIYIQGLVVDSQTNEELVGVSVVIKGTTRGTITGTNGKFSIESPLNSILVFSYMGYNSQEIQVKSALINVQLVAKSVDLNDIVVIGYGSVKKKDLTGAIGVADVKDMKKTQATTISEALQGRIPGVTVKTSGEPGQTAKIFIRGISSMYSNTDPLYVIDGLPTSETRDFNPDDIESIQVLKDASAAAIYGSRAANGVIIITTKKGSKKDALIEASAKYGIQNTVKRYNLMNGQEWLALQDMKYANAGKTSLFNIADRTINTDWQNQIYQTGQTQEYNFSAQGGSKNTSYFVSGNHFANDGVVKGTEFDRTTVRVNGSLTKKRLKIDESLLASTSNSNDLVGGFFTDIIRMPPLLPVYQSDGTYALGGYNGAETNGENPVAHRNFESKGNTSYRLQGSVNAELEIFSFLKYKLTLGGEFNSNIYQDKTKYGIWSPNQVSRSKFYEDRNYNTSYLIENILTYDKRFDKNYINAMIGYTRQKFESSNDLAEVIDLKPDNQGTYYWTLSNGQNPVVQQVLNSNSLASYLGRIMYTYDEKYYLTTSIRRDGSSRFNVSNRWGNFPSLALAWRISKENFLKKITWIDDLKMRVSYGVLGQEGIPNNLTDVYNNNYFPYPFGSPETMVWGSSPTAIVNENIRWEEKQSSNVGLDLTLLGSAITINADYYINKSNGLLAKVPLGIWTGSWTSAFDFPMEWANAGSVQNQGFEFSIVYRNQKNPFKFDISLNATTIQNKILSLGNNAEPIYGTHTKSEVGRSLGEFYVVKTNGIYQLSDFDSQGNVIGNITQVWGSKPRPGDQKYIDINGREANGQLTGKPDGKIDIDDRQYVGSPWPKAELSLNFSASYKNFDFMMYLFSSLGRNAYNGTKNWLYNVGDNGNYAAGLNPWTETNPSNITPKAYYDELLQGESDRFIEDASFLRFKTLQVGYNLSNKICKNIGMSNLRLFISGENLFTITKYQGLDPDFKNTDPFSLGFDGGSYPNVRTISGGLQLSF